MMHGVCHKRKIFGPEIYLHCPEENEGGRGGNFTFSRRKSDLIFSLPEGNQTST